MHNTPTITRISPKLVTDNMETTLAFYRDLLGFECTLQAQDYTILARNGQTLHFGRSASEEVMQCVRGHTEIYIEVVGIDALWRHVQALSTPFRIRELFQRDYGMTEFHIEDPNGCLVFVGETTPAAQTPQP